ncbi:MAG TPA: hypothetical protein VLO07_03550 [Thermoanaerobaculia bacterium]|nr:hypothetical protein [Thermoanaerobaculia bacterium]
MNPLRWMLLAVLTAPIIAYLVYRLAKGLGFLDPPVDKQHEYRREIIVALYSFLLFLPMLLYGYEKGWPRAWILFGIFNALALIFFAVSGVWSARRLWRLRHPEDQAAFRERRAEKREAGLAEAEIRGRDTPLADLPASPEASRGIPD